MGAGCLSKKWSYQFVTILAKCEMRFGQKWFLKNALTLFARLGALVTYPPRSASAKS